VPTTIAVDPPKRSKFDVIQLIKLFADQFSGFSINVKKDVFPNRERTTWFRAEKTGEYDIACAEYCGLNHSYMYSKIIVLSEEDYKNWMYGMSDEDLKLLEEMTKGD